MRTGGDPGGLDGTWQRAGYGVELHVGETEVRWLDTCALGALEVMRERTSAFLRRHAVVDVGAGDVLTIRPRGAITSYRHVRTPPTTKVRAIDTAALPEVVFDWLWHHAEEQFAFFSQRRLDWSATRRRLRPIAIRAGSDERLFAVLTEMLDELQDGHASLDGAGLEYERVTPMDLWERWKRDDPRPAGARFRRAMRDAASSLLRGRRASWDERAVWGWLSDDVGYLALDGMRRFAEGVDDDVDRDAVAASEAVGAAVTDLSSASRLVVDVRWNGGGHDGVALAAAAHFADGARLAFVKRARDGVGWTEDQRIEVEVCAGPRFVGPTTVLTSGSTCSAAEIFVLAMRVQPHVTVAGSSTNGMLSDALERRLPNGWSATFSNEIYEAADGRCYEGEGIPVDRRVPAGADEGWRSWFERTVRNVIGD